MGISAIATLVAFVFYLAFMVFVGVISMIKTRNADDYFLGGRNLSGPVAVMFA